MKSARMTSRPTAVLLSGVLVLGLGAPYAASQDAEDEARSESVETRATTSPSSEPLLVMGSGLVGTTVLDTLGHPTGIARDLVLDADGRILAALVGTLDDEGLHPVPLQALHAVPTALDPEADPDELATPRELERLRLSTLTRDELAASPRCNLSSPLDRARLEHAYELHGVAADALDGRAARPTGDLHDAQDPATDRGRGRAAGHIEPASTRGAVRRLGPGGSEHDLLAPDLAAVLASEIRGRAVENPDGDELGHIGELVLRIDRAEVAYAVLESGGLLGFGEKRFAVPFARLTARGDGLPLTLDVDAARLEQAAGFATWPRAADDELFKPIPDSDAEPSARPDAPQDGPSGG